MHVSRRFEPRRLSVWAFLEGLAWTIGLALVALWAALTVMSGAARREGLQAFATLRAATQLEAQAPDLSLWSAPRVRAWQATLTQKAPAPVAVLRIPRLHLEVPVFEGTEDSTLDRGAGHITGTAPPGSKGNSGIAGHRDGFFRILKDIGAGDAVELQTPNATETYRVERIWIVTPDDVSVLDPTSSPAVTLVTCYPFYFIGSAPQRFIVRAVRTASTD